MVSGLVNPLTLFGLPFENITMGPGRENVTSHGCHFPR